MKKIVVKPGPAYQTELVVWKDGELLISPQVVERGRIQRGDLIYKIPGEVLWGDRHKGAIELDTRLIQSVRVMTLPESTMSGNRPKIKRHKPNQTFTAPSTNTNNAKWVQDYEKKKRRSR